MYINIIFKRHISISDVKIQKRERGEKWGDKQCAMFGVNILHFVYFASL